MTKNNLIICLNTRLQALSKKYDATKDNEHNAYIMGYTKGIEEALSLVKTLKEDRHETV